MSRRSRRTVRRRHSHNRNLRARRNRKRSPQQFVYALFDLPPTFRQIAGMAVSPYYAAAIAKKSQLERELALADRMAALGFDMREEHDAISNETEALKRTSVVARGHRIEYAEIDGIRLCITEHGWCEREYGHTPPHVYAPKEKP